MARVLWARSAEPPLLTKRFPPQKGCGFRDQRAGPVGGSTWRAGPPRQLGLRAAIDGVGPVLLAYSSMDLQGHGQHATRCLTPARCRAMCSVPAAVAAGHHS